MTIWRNRSRPAILTMLLAVTALSSVAPAMAQDPLSRFLDGIFKQEQQPRQQAPAPLPPPAPASTPLPLPAPAAAPTAAPAAAPAILAPQQQAPASVSTPMAAPAAVSAGVPLPPRRPPEFGGGAAVAVSPAQTAPAQAALPVSPVAVQPDAPQQQAAARGVPRTSNEAVSRLNAYLNSMQRMTATFMQTGADGRQAGGSLYVERPGRLRFAYDPPSTLEIVADGKSVAVRDSKLRTNDVYSIGQTPLKFLLRSQVDLARDMKLRNVQIDPGGLIDVTVEDSTTIGGTSVVTLRYDARADVLRQWIVVDPQGYETTVVLSNVRILPRS